MTIVTVEDLARAMMDRMGLGADDAESQAEYVLDIFGFETEIIDNVLGPEDRQLFYAMESHGLVATRSDETQLWHGQDWRTHAWILRPERILASPAADRLEAAREADEGGAVYATLPADCWSRPVRS